MNITTSTPPSFYHWEERSPEEDQAIEGAFNSRVHLTESGWGTDNGKPHYCLSQVDEQKLLKEMILRAPPQQKVFKVLEIGAGEFQWGKALADFINKQTDLPDGITVEIYSVRAETNLGPEFYSEGRCKRINLGAFKAENIFQAFKDAGYPVTAPFDLVLSNWSFRHMVNPVRVLAQVLALMGLGALLLIDGFHFHYHHKGPENKMYPILRMTQLVFDSNHPFVTFKNNQSGTLNHFVIQKSNNPPRAEYRYSGLETLSQIDLQNLQVGSGYITQFERICDDTSTITCNFPRDDKSLYGDQTLFEQLKAMDVLIDPDLTHKPFLYSLPDLGSLPEDVLFQAIREGDVPLVLESLRNDLRTYQKDSNGQTPLILSMLNQNKEIFEILLNNHLGREWGIHETCPLHVAATVDKEGFFIKALLKAGAKIDQQNSASKTALQIALEEKNVQAVKILIESGARICPDDYELLQDDLFASVHQRCGVMKTPIEKTSGPLGFEKALDFIKEGHCVILHYQGKNGLIYNLENGEQKKRDLILIDVNPAFPILSDEEWPAYLKAAGYDYYKGQGTLGDILGSQTFENTKTYNCGY